MRVEEIAASLDRAADRLPDPERPPTPAQSELSAFAVEHARLAMECRRELDRKMENINAMERFVWWILASSLLAGMLLSGYVHSVSRPAPQAEFLPEKP